MFFLYKLIQELFLRPEVWTAGLLIAALVVIHRGRARAGGWMVLAALGILWLASMRPVSELLIRPLEPERMPSPEAVAKLGPFDAVVVLGGGCHFLPDRSGSTVLGAPTASRVAEGVALFKAGVAPRLVLAGGSGDMLGRGPAEGPAMKALAVELAVPEAAILVDDRSRTTAENATEVGRLLQPGARKIVLVSTATHLRRAARLFRRAGFDVVVVAAGFLAPGDSYGPSDFLPRAEQLAKTDEAIHEWVGLIRARLGG